MVRQTKQTPDDKKESHKKKTTPPDDRLPKKKTNESTAWPCKINGCNKLFAREADLKRHQRTTKLHSVPSFACPQCDATFTRTDALRRHQKSRHNGVVIEPSDPERRRDTASDDPQSSTGKPKSRSRSPSSKDKENPIIHTPSSLPPTTHPPGGPQNYYRQHTLPGVILPPPPPGMLVDGQYPGLPTSATRLHQATWPHPHSPWTDGSQPPPHHSHMIPIGYPPPHPGAAYYPSPYYRTNMVPPPHPDLVPHSPPPYPHHLSNSTGSPDTGGSSSSRTRSPADGDSAGVVPVIDPSLDVGASTGGSRAGGKTPIPLEIAVSAVLNSVSAERESSIGSTGAISGHATQVSEEDEPKTSRGDLSSASDVSNSNALGSTLERPPEMEQMLTEDGEPMLNPAELLTQESLASPPPS